MTDGETDPNPPDKEQTETKAPETVTKAEYDALMNEYGILKTQKKASDKENLKLLEERIEGERALLHNELTALDKSKDKELSKLYEKSTPEQLKIAITTAKMLRGEAPTISETKKTPKQDNKTGFPTWNHETKSWEDMI